MSRPHRRLLVWQKAINLVETIYTATALFPRDEQFGLSSQMRRSAVSIPSNLAEGAARLTDKDKLHFFHISRGSLSELDTQLEIARRLGYLNTAKVNEAQSLIDHVMALINGLIASRRSV